MTADRLLVHPSKEAGERKSRSGILIPATANVDRRLVWGEVVALGPTVRNVEPHDRVLFSPESGYEVEIRGDDYLILRERDIHAVASERSEGATGLYLSRWRPVSRISVRTRSPAPPPMATRAIGQRGHRQSAPGRRPAAAPSASRVLRCPRL